jgi:tRNA threonylcarbamoyladenosine biosynthesis protein TsaE
MSMKEMMVNELGDWRGVADSILQIAGDRRALHAGATIVTLTGDLGAGKTTLTQQIAKTLGVTSNVTSPTFVIMQKYECADNADWKHLVHIDAYRLEGENSENISALKLSQYFDDPNNIVCIEWSEYISELLTDRDIVSVNISLGSDEQRVVTVQ